MPKKVQARVDPFHDDAVIRGLLALPDQFQREAERTSNPQKIALRHETALAIAILIHLPLRRSELLGLRLDQHIQTERRGGRVVRRLVLPAHMVKNNVDRTAELSPRVEELLDRFLAEHRPALVTCDSPYLFSKRGKPEPLSASCLVRTIEAATSRHLGIRLSPHNFRHLAGVVYLRQRPGDLDGLRRLLGHRHESTTRAHYDYLLTDDANRAWGTILDGHRKAAR
ncbi:tyrosine-type recombinase/integrase [Halovulum sp. GXIMD14794]